MSRRNTLILVASLLAAFLFYQRVLTSPYTRVMSQAMRTIRRHALEPVEEAKLFENAMHGMLDRLDPHSAYIEPGKLDAYTETLDLQFAGVGLQLAPDPKTTRLRVISPLVGSPAQRAGILAGDLILRIGKSDTKGMSLATAAGLLRGRPGEPVTLSVLREGEKQPKEIRLVREIIHKDSVVGDTRNADGSWNFFLDGHPRIGYVRIGSFTDATAAELKKAIAQIASRHVQGLVLDLRDNPGGYVDSAVQVCDLFLRSGAIVTTRYRSGRSVHTSVASGNAPYADLPLVVLVNDETASAAEIVAACLQDNRRAAIVGQRTYGKGTVQDIIQLGKDYGAMRLTVASYWRPNGQNIDRRPDAKEKDTWGVSPDKGCQVVLDKAEYERWLEWRAGRDVFQSPTEKKEKPFVDRQLDRAVEQLEKRG